MTKKIKATNDDEKTMRTMINVASDEKNYKGNFSKDVEEKKVYDFNGNEDDIEKQKVCDFFF